MNTPAHVAASLLVWRKEKGTMAASAVVLGALLPDLPMFGFYGYQKIVVGSSEREIWSRLYFQDHWQLLFDVMNSIPLALACLALFAWIKFPAGKLCAASALLHMLFDLPLHHDDAHRHFLPLTHWRFASPVSYWDPRHFGLQAALLEFLFAVAAAAFVCIKGPGKPIRIAALATLAMYLAGIAFAVMMWMGLE